MIPPHESRRGLRSEQVLTIVYTPFGGEGGDDTTSLASEIAVVLEGSLSGVASVWGRGRGWNYLNVLGEVCD